ncbi:MAG: hypothetical protein AB7S56_08495 [Halothiobacillaceae bacterium]
MQEKLAAATNTAAIGISELKDIPLEKLGQMMMLSAMNSEYFNSSRMVDMIEKGSPFISSVVDLFNDKLDPDEIPQAKKDIVEMEKSTQAAPSNEGTIYAQLDDALQKVRTEKFGGGNE